MADEPSQVTPTPTTPPLTPEQKKHILAAVETVGKEVLTEVESGTFSWRNILIVAASFLLGSGATGTGAYFAMAPSSPAPVPRDAIILPKRIDVKLGHAATIKADVAGDVSGLTWLAPDGGDWMADGNVSASFTGWSVGDYPVIGVGVQGGKPVLARTIIGVGIDPAPPNPTPPAPVPPTPVPPAPTSPLTVQLQAAYTADPGSPVAKSGQKVLLQGLYEAMIDHAKATTIATTGALLADLQTVAGQMLAPKTLIDVRKIIAVEIAAAIGTDATAKLDPDLRPKAVDAFTRIAKSLSEVK